MVSLIQNTLNRDSQAMPTKLDELIRAFTDTGNALIAIEQLIDKELDALHSRCKARGASRSGL